MGRFKIRGVGIAGVSVIERSPQEDSRGSFERLFCDSELSGILAGSSVVQVNRSRTRRAGAIRGMHFQFPPHAEKKFVSCVRGEVFDVAVDIRRGSPTFLQWYGQRLSEDNHLTLVIPEGFAHGFQALQDGSEIVYCCTAAYAPDAESGLNPADPAIGVEWPLAITELSDRDRARDNVDTAFAGVAV